MKGMGLGVPMVVAAVLLIGSVVAGAEDEEAAASDSAPKVEMLPGQGWHGRPITGWDRQFLLRSESHFPAETTENVFRRVASELPELDLGAVEYDRTTFLPGAPELAQKWDGLVREVVDPRHDPAVVEALAADADPHVCTLALAALFCRVDPKVLPVIARYVQDQRESFPRPLLTNSYTVERYGERFPSEPRTVADVARSMLRFYGVPYRADREAFNQWWAERKDRKESLAWLRARMKRATQGTTPVQPDRRLEISLVYYHVDHLPDVYRELALISLFDNERLFDVMATDFSWDGGLERQLVYAARRLYTSGHLLPLMQGKEEVDDPDWGPAGLTLFAMEHATEVLQPGEAEELLAWRDSMPLEGAGNQLLWDWLTVGVARLQPERAVGLLVPLLERGRRGGSRAVEPAVELWRLSGGTQAERLVDWFYEMPPGESMEKSRSNFFRFVIRRFSEDDRRWVARMVYDERFEYLDWGVLREVVTGLNKNFMPDVTAPDDLGRRGQAKIRDRLRRWAPGDGAGQTDGGPQAQPDLPAREPGSEAASDRPGPPQPLRILPAFRETKP